MEISTDDAHYKGCVWLLVVFMFAIVALAFAWKADSGLLTSLFVLWFVSYLALWVAEQIYKSRHPEP